VNRVRRPASVLLVLQLVTGQEGIDVHYAESAQPRTEQKIFVVASTSRELRIRLARGWKEAGRILEGGLKEARRKTEEGWPEVGRKLEGYWKEA